jgi:hypothetical protein
VRIVAFGGRIGACRFVLEWRLGTVLNSMMINLLIPYL